MKRIRHFSILLIFLLCGATLGFASENILQPGGWKAQDLRKRTVYSFSKQENGFKVKIKSAQNQKSILSIYQNLPTLDLDGELLLFFKMKYSTADCRTSVALSESPGCNEPCARNWLPNENRLNEKWQEINIDIPLRGLKEKGSVLEFIWEGYFKPGFEFCVSDITLKYRDVPYKLDMFFLSPVSGIVIDEGGKSEIRGVLQPSRNCAGDTVELKVTEEKSNQLIAATKQKVIYPESPWSFNCTDLPSGKYILSATIDKDNNEHVQSTVLFQKKKVDELITFVKDGTLYYKNKPFLPLAIYHAGIWNIERLNSHNLTMKLPTISFEQAYKEMEEKGLNTLLADIRNDSAEKVGRFMKIAADNNLFTVPYLNTETIEQLAGAAENFAWYGGEEPNRGQDTKRAILRYSKIREMTPENVVFSTYCSPHPLLGMEHRGTTGDVLFLDSYVVRNKESDLSETSRNLKMLAPYFEEELDLVLGLVPQAFIYQGSEPTPEQLRAQTYIGVVNNIRAFIFYAWQEDFSSRPFNADKEKYPTLPEGMSKNIRRKHWWIGDSILWDSLPELTRELRDLEDFILNDGREIKVRCKNSKIDFAAKEVNSINYFIAVNMTAEPTEAIFGFSKSVNFEDFFAQSETKYSGSKLNMNFKPYEVKVLSSK